jgi:hypothetical protein
LRDSIGACAPSDSKIGTELVGTLTHLDVPQLGNRALPAQRPASSMRLTRFTIDTHMKLCFAGATHTVQPGVREQIHVTLKTSLDNVLNLSHHRTHNNILPKINTCKVFNIDSGNKYKLNLNKYVKTVACAQK